MYKCPLCGSPFEKGEAVCKKCGYDLAGKFIYDPICPKCGRKYPAGSHLCEKDYTDLIPFEKFAPKCVRCQRSFTPDVEVCPYDGSSIRPRVGGPRDTRVNMLDENLKKTAYYSDIQNFYIYPKVPFFTRLEGWLGDFFLVIGLKLLIALISIIIQAAILLVIQENSIVISLLAQFFTIIGYIIPGIYSLLKDGMGKGQSWGKKTAGIMVVDIKTNEPCSMGKSVLRNVIFYVPGINIVEFIMVLANHNGQRIGDVIAKTQVIEVNQYAPELTKKAESASEYVI